MTYDFTFKLFTYNVINITNYGLSIFAIGIMESNNIPIHVQIARSFLFLARHTNM